MTRRRTIGCCGALAMVVVSCGGRSLNDGANEFCEGDANVVCHCSDGRLGIAACLSNQAIGICDCDPTATLPGDPGSGGTASGGTDPGTGNANGGASVSAGGDSNLGGNASTICETQGIAYQVVDADYSDALDRIVLLTATPNAVVLLDPRTLETTSIPLPLLGTSISVGPGGHQAAVAQDGYLSVVDLDTASVAKTIATTTVSGDVVMAGNGYAYLFPESDQWVGIHSIEVTAALDHGNDNSWQIYAGMLTKLHPGGTTIYGITVGVSPTDIESYDISSGVVGAIKDSPYHGDYSMCGDLWVSKDGLRILTGCGTAFRAAPGTTDDLTYNGKLEEVTSSSTTYRYGPRYQSITHDAKNGRLYAIPASDNWDSSAAPSAAEATVDGFSYEYLSFEATRPIPCMFAGNNRTTVYGRYVFAAAAGDYIYVIAKAAQSGLLQPWGVVALEVK